MPIYVGISNKPERRLREHKRSVRFSGRDISLYVVEQGNGRENGLAAELRWIEKFTSRGVVIENLMTSNGGGCHTHALSTRQRLSRASKGKSKPDGFGDKLSKITKGRPKIFSAEGDASNRKTRFAAGHRTWDTMDDETKARMIDARRKQWDKIPPEERTERAVQRNRKMWANRTPEQRAEVARRISEAKKRKYAAGVVRTYRRTPEENAAIGRKISATLRAKALAKNREAAPLEE